jgi:F0F1-type ATP synthase membrane subunit b/b'
MVTSKTREEIRADLEQAEKLGVLVVTREDVEQELTSTLRLPNADQIYERAEQTIRELKAKHIGNDEG